MFRPSSDNTSISVMKQKVISDIPSSSEGSTHNENVLPGCSKMFPSTRSNISSSEGSTEDEMVTLEPVTLEPVNPSAAIKNALPRQKKTKKDVRPKRAKTSSIRDVKKIILMF